MGIESNYPNRYTARFAPLEYWDNTDPTKRGFIPVEFEDEIVWARPIFRLGEFMVPTKEFVQQNIDTVAVVVEVLDNQEGKLAWSGFTYWEEATPKDTQEHYPYQKILYADEQWKVFCDSREEEPIFFIEHADGTRLQFHREEGQRKLEYIDKQLNHHVLLDEEGTFFKDGVNGARFETTEDGVKITDEVNESVVNLSTEGITVQDGVSRSSVELTPQGAKITDAKNNTNIVSSNVTLGLGNGTEEPLILGFKLVDLLNEMLQALSTHTHPTSMGPTGPPINGSTFIQQTGKLPSLSSKVSKTE